ncbi:hypothetical protein F4780DRAFT_549664 [Xylariomycetidae sp. FL0641]|nr:hypothetical protein F4780DRAFT_549664 [Xylariomycetidae sp. FL0641]
MMDGLAWRAASTFLASPCQCASPSRSPGALSSAIITPYHRSSAPARWVLLGDGFNRVRHTSKYLEVNSQVLPKRHIHKVRWFLCTPYCFRSGAPITVPYLAIDLPHLATLPQSTTSPAKRPPICTQYAWCLPSRRSPCFKSAALDSRLSSLSDLQYLPSRSGLRMRPSFEQFRLLLTYNQLATPQLRSAWPRRLIVSIACWWRQCAATAAPPVQQRGSPTLAHG